MTGMSAGVAELKRRLPHRHPMLLLDRVVQVESGARLIARKAVTCNEPWYERLADDAAERDHDYPAVLLVESCCQAAGLLATWDAPVPDARGDRVMLFGGISGVRISGRVRPGDVVEHQVRLVRSFADTVIFEGRSTVGDETVMEIEQLVIAFRPGSGLATATPATADRT